MTSKPVTEDQHLAASGESQPSRSRQARTLYNLLACPICKIGVDLGSLVLLLPYWLYKAGLYIFQGKWSTLRASALDHWRNGPVPFVGPRKI